MMVSDDPMLGQPIKDSRVLILVLMDDGLWSTANRYLDLCQEVLILVLMDDGLWLGYEDHDKELPWS